MAVNFGSAVAAYANAGKIVDPAGPAAQQGTGTSFGDLLRSTGESTLDTLHKGEQASLQALTGKADLTEVTAAVNSAEVALQTVTAVRDKIVQAYQAIIQMPI